LLHFHKKLIHVVDTASQNGASYDATRSHLCVRLRDKSLIIARVDQPLSIAPITRLALPAKREYVRIRGIYRR